MKYDIFDANEILSQSLNIDEVKSVINGSVYNNGRPLNSLNEDIVVNTITISQNTPQRATSNINIYVPDINSGVNNRRLKEISRKVLEVFNSTQFPSKSVYISNQTIIKETNNKEHYVNIRIEWIIYDQKTN